MSSLDTTVAQLVSMPGWGELLIIAFIGLLLFGKRLPEVGKSLGKGIVEFKKGLKGIDDDVETAVNRKYAEAQPPRIEAHGTPPPVSERQPENTEAGSRQP